MKGKILTALLMAAVAASAAPLQFNPSGGQPATLTMPRGEQVNYTAYTRLYYVQNVEDSTFQYLNIFVPEGASEQTPIFMPNYVGGFMAAEARMPDPGDASGRALAEGYVVVIPGARGRNSTVNADGQTIFDGRAPKGLLDLKAAVRYLREFDAKIPGNSELIITDGTSAGGAMSSLLGSSGNNPVYEEALMAMGATRQRDDIFAAVCYCPIVDLGHADIMYEWNYQCTNKVTRPLTEAQLAVSRELAAMFPGYIDSLDLRRPNGTPLTADNYMDYIRDLLIESAQYAKDAGAEIPDSIGFTFSRPKGFRAPVNGRVADGKPNAPKGLKRPRSGFDHSEYIVDLDMDRYLNFVVTTQPLKTPPAFDSQGVAGGRPSGENELFGDEHGSSVNFTEFSLRHAAPDPEATGNPAYAPGNPDAVVNPEIARNVRLLNPMEMMADPASTVAPNWYIRHGARDRDTAFVVPVNLATRLQNQGKNVDFRLAWNRPHSGDYALDDLFAWLRTILPSRQPQ